MRRLLIHFFPLTLLLLAFIWRFTLIQYVPFSFYHDEFDYIFAGQSVAQFGTDITGQWSPWQLRPLQTLNRTAELPAFFHSLFYSIFYDSVLWGRIPSAVFGIFTLGVLFLLFRTVTRRTDVSLWAMAFLASSPWHIFISRSGFEAGISLFFQLLVIFASFLLLEWLPKKSTVVSSQKDQQTTLNKVLFVAVLFVVAYFFGFFTYHGAKFTLLALSSISLVLLLLGKYQLKYKVAISVVVATCMLSSVAWVAFQSNSGSYGAREGELIFSTEYVEEMKTQERTLTMHYDSVPLLRPLVSNEVTVLALQFIKQYTSVFDVHRLFVTGYEGTFQFSLIVHSYFMLSGLVTIPLGCWWLLNNAKEKSRWLLAFFVVSPVASAIATSTQSIFRSSATYALLMAVSGVGAWYLFELIRLHMHRKQLKTAVILLVSTIFIAESLWFGSRYFSKYPIVAIDNHDFEHRLLSNYLVRLDEYKKVTGSDQVTPVIVQKEPWNVARAYVGYSGILSALTAQDRLAFNSVQAGVVSVNSYSFQLECSDLESLDVYVLHPALYEECNNEAAELAIREGRAKKTLAQQSGATGAVLGVDTNSNPTAAPEAIQNEKIILAGLSSPVDSRTYYWIMNDPICAQYNLPLFTTVGSFSKYKFEELTNEEFCVNWMKREER